MRELLEQFPDVDRIRILGRRENASLIAGLCDFQSRCDTGVRFEVGGFLGLDFSTAGEALATCRAPSALQESRSRWTTLRDSDRPVYAIAGGDRDDRHIANHPANSAFSFMHVPAEDAMHFSAVLVDPRWFRHPFRESRFSLIHSRFAIHPATAKRAVDLFDASEDGDRIDFGSDTGLMRFVVATGLWRHHEEGMSDFVLRRVRRYDETWKRILEATRVAVDFAVSVWLNGVSIHPDDRLDVSKYLDDAIGDCESAVDVD